MITQKIIYLSSDEVEFNTEAEALQREEWISIAKHIQQTADIDFVLSTKDAVEILIALLSKYNISHK